MTDAGRATLRRMGDKAASGRFITTISACVIWAVLAFRGYLGSEFNATMIAVVINSYFQRKRAEDSE